MLERFQAKGSELASATVESVHVPLVDMRAVSANSPASRDMEDARLAWMH